MRESWTCKMKKQTLLPFEKKGLFTLVALLLCILSRPLASQADDMGAKEEAFSLNLNQAIQLSLQHNLTVLLARERENEAHGRETESLAQLLPNLYVTASQANATQNLAALGFPPRLFPISPLIGPYYTFDARVHLAQTLFNLSAARRHAASQVDLQITHLQEKLAEEQIATATVMDYLRVLETQEAVDAASANVDLAISLEKQAKDQHDAGMANGVDVLRASTRLAEKELALSQAETQLEQAGFQLKRAIGIPLGKNLDLKDVLPFTATSPSPVNDLLKQAFHDRFELQVASEAVRRDELNLSAAKGEGDPTLYFGANYGLSGNTPGLLSLPTRWFGMNFDLPIFNGGLTKGHIQEFESKKHQSELILNDTHDQIEEDVRMAIQTLLTTAKQVQSAQQSLDLAKRQLDLARDRFKSGLGDNIQVLDAETSLENARNAQVLALAMYNQARLNLAASLGHALQFQL